MEIFQDIKHLNLMGSGGWEQGSGVPRALLTDPPPCPEHSTTFPHPPSGQTPRNLQRPRLCVALIENCRIQEERHSERDALL